MATDTLTERELRILAFERRFLTHSGAKEDAIRTEFRLRAARYYQLLNALIKRPAALAHDPQLVRRLLNMQERSTRARASKAFS